jgi:FixJ family two-component response regulator
MTHLQTIYVVDDRARDRHIAGELAHAMGLDFLEFASAEKFLSEFGGEPGCVIVALELPAMGGLDLQRELMRRHCDIPVIIVARHAYTAIVVEAMKNGAVSVLDKPCDEQCLWEAVRTALDLDEEHQARRRQETELRRRLTTLTDNELDVLRMIVAGKANKAIASKLGASIRTVENRRRNLYTKLGVRSLAEMVALTLRAKERGIWLECNGSESPGRLELAASASH